MIRGLATQGGAMAKRKKSRAKGPSKTDLLGKVPLFAECNQKELDRIASLADQVDIDEGTKLTTEGRPGREFFVVADGWAKVTLRKRKLGTLGRGSFFGEMSLLDSQPRAATVTAETPMTLYVIDPRSFATLLDKTPSVSRKIMKGIAARIRKIEGAPGA